MTTPDPTDTDERDQTVLLDERGDLFDIILSPHEARHLVGQVPRTRNDRHQRWELAREPRICKLIDTFGTVETHADYEISDIKDLLAIVEKENSAVPAGKEKSR